MGRGAVVMTIATIPSPVCDRKSSTWPASDHPLIGCVSAPASTGSSVEGDLDCGRRVVSIPLMLVANCSAAWGGSWALVQHPLGMVCRCDYRALIAHANHHARTATRHPLNERTVHESRRTMTLLQKSFAAAKMGTVPLRSETSLFVAEVSGSKGTVPFSRRRSSFFAAKVISDAKIGIVPVNGSVGSKDALCDPSGHGDSRGR